MRRPSISTRHADINQGVWLHQQGRLAEAERIYKQVLQREPRNANALHLLGVAALQGGQAARAVDLIGRSIALQPDLAEAHCNRGLALQQAGRIAEAIASYDRAIVLNPRDADAHSNRGLALEMLRRHDEALASYDRAVALNPKLAEAHNNRGNALRALGRYQEALEAHGKAIALQPDYAGAHYNHGNALLALQRPAEAIASYDTAIALRPDHAEAYSNRGHALRDLRRFQEALDSYDRAIALRPDIAEIHNNRGAMLQALKQPAQAVAGFDRAIALRPDYAEAYNSRGTALQDLNRSDEALASYRRSIALRPDYADAYTNQALCLLRMGCFAEGWKLFEWRKRRPEAMAARAYRQPLWLGEPDVAGKTVFLYWEQGLGDTLQFCRYATLVAQRGARVILEVQQPLVGFLSQLGPEIEVIGPGQAPTEFDYHCPLLSLPLAFGTDAATIPSTQSYLQADPALAAGWHDRFGEKRPRIGLAWSGGERYSIDFSRSMDFSTAAPLLEFDATWVCVQYEIRPHDLASVIDDGRISFPGEAIKDFSEQAALLDTLDLVITVDTVVGHLTAAMGKQVWLLLAYNSDWRWLLGRDDSPWYPSVRLFRQQEPAPWSGLIDRVRNELSSTFG